jgi:hypothetical protein
MKKRRIILGKNEKEKRKSMWGMEKKNMYILFPIMIINWNAYEIRSDLFIECTKTIMILKERGKHIISSKQIFFPSLFLYVQKSPSYYT